MLYGIIGVDIFPISDLLYPNMKVGVQLIRARPNFYMISDNPNVSLGIVDCYFYTQRIAVKDEYYKKRMDTPAYTPVEFNNLGTLAKTFIIPAGGKQFIQENISIMLQFVWLLLQWIQTLHSLDLILKIHSGINNLISDELEDSEEVSQL